MTSASPPPAPTLSQTNRQLNQILQALQSLDDKAADFIAKRDALKALLLEILQLQDIIIAGAAASAAGEFVRIAAAVKRVTAGGGRPSKVTI
ncbi:MAG: hypothetical protein GC191_02950 [Azospirillum sp.]|nr:hypothetical protein [Azospirillum sp.]